MRVLIVTVAMACLACHSPEPSPARLTEPEAVAAPVVEAPPPEAEAARTPPQAKHVEPPVDAQVRSTSAPEYEEAGQLQLIVRGAPEQVLWTSEEELAGCESLWAAVDAIAGLEDRPYVMAQLICDNGADYASRELRTVLLRYDLEAGSAEELWSGPGRSTNEMDACIDYEVYAFVMSEDGQSIEVSGQKERIRTEFADEFDFDCKSVPLTSEFVTRFELGD